MSNASESVTCVGASVAAAEPLAGTATEGTHWLLVEVRGAWGRDAVADSGLPPEVAAALAAFPGKAILVRRPDRRSGVTVIRAEVDETGGVAVLQELETLADLPSALNGGGDPVSGGIVLVCAHGRRDACCARLGRPLFSVLEPHFAPTQLWQSSHLGGHRFAPNVLVLPGGVQLGRIPVERAAEVAELLGQGRIPLDLYRGRTIYAPRVQAAEICVRTATGCDHVTDVRLVSVDGALVTFSTPSGELTAEVAEDLGPAIPVSCGAEPETPCPLGRSPTVDLVIQSRHGERRRSYDVVLLRNAADARAHAPAERAANWTAPLESPT